MSDVTSDTDQIRDEITQTRADLAETVDALSAKLDVKAQAKAKVDDVKNTVSGTVAKAEPYRAQLLAAAAAVAVLVFLARHRRGRR